MITTISNPPFNMKWDIPMMASIQPRFQMTNLPPKGNANYAFILTALNISDRCLFILPNNILNTNDANEREIKKYLVEHNFVDAVVICPPKMFESTDIGTCILVLDKHKKTATVEMVDLRHKYTVESREQKGQFGGDAHEKRVYTKEKYILSDSVIDDVSDCISERKNIAGYAKSVSMQEIRKNDYILNPSRYIDFVSEDAPRRNYSEIVNDINTVIRQKNMCKLTINETIARSLGFDLDLYKNDEYAEELQRLVQKIAGCKIVKSNYFSATKNKCEIKFENGSKEELSSILIMIMNQWKQHIYFLNQEENKYLAELRDSLIEDLMSGKLEVD